MSRLQAFYKEPRVHFLLIGALLFKAYELRQKGGDLAPERVLVDSGQIGQLSILKIIGRLPA